MMLTLVACAVLAGHQARARDLALVVGNNGYRNVTRLNTAVADAQAVGDRLEGLGFVVRRAIDADQSAMSRALAAFDADLRPGDRAVFFYAGHGMEISGANYLLPTDVPAAMSNQRDLVRDASVPVERVIDGIRERGAAVAVLVLDACRDNPFATPGSRSAAVTGGLARVDAPQGVFVLMSAGAKQEALDRLSDADPDKDSVFTRTFLRELVKPNLTLVQIAKATQVGVRDLAASVGYEQTPAYYDQVIGDVVLSRDASAPAPAMPAPAPPAAPLTATPPPPAGSPLPPTRQQLAALPQPLIPATPPANSGRPFLGGRAPIANFLRSGTGWTVTVSLPEAALGLSYRIGDAGAFKPTGLSDTIDRQTGERMPNLSFPLAANAPRTVIQLRYTTQDGGTVGPFAILFDPDVELFRFEKKVLEQMSSNWAMLSGGAAPLLYFTILVSYRCAISELHYGLDGAPPLARFDLPGCDPSKPFEIPYGATLFLRVPPPTRSVNLQITWRDGTQSEVTTINAR
jgi:hypothetical protein